MRERSETFYVQINWRKAISEFSSEAIPRDVIETCVLAVGTAPSDPPTNPGTLQWCKATLLQCPENEKP